MYDDRSHYVVLHMLRSSFTSKHSTITMSRKLASIHSHLSLLMMTMLGFWMATEQSLAFRVVGGGSSIRTRRLQSAMIDENQSTNNSTVLLDPVTVSNKVFRDDQRPVILFDGGTRVTGKERMMITINMPTTLTFSSLLQFVICATRQSTWP